MRESSRVIPGLPQQPVESGQRKGAAVLPPQHSPCFQVPGDVHGVPAGIDGPVHCRRRALFARFQQMFARAGQQGLDFAFAFPHARLEFREFPRDPQNIFRRVVLHLADRFDVVVQLDGQRLVRRQRRPHLVLRPGEIIPVILQRNVRILARIEAAAAGGLGEHGIRPPDDAFHCLPEQRIARDLPRVQVIQQQRRIVIAHFFEMRHAPALVHGVAVEASANLVVHAAARHLRQRRFHHRQQMAMPAGLIPFRQEIHRGRMRKFRRAPEPAVADVELAHRRVFHIVQQARRKRAAGFAERLRLRHRVRQCLRRTVHVRAALAVGLGHRGENSPESRPPHGVVRREIGPAEKRPPIGRQESGQRPAALAGDGADGRLVARVHVGPLVAVHLHGNVELVDECGDFGVLVALAVNYVAPVAPHRADVQQDGFVLGARPRKGLFAPFVPVHGLMVRRPQIRAR